MACPEFEDLLREGQSGHAARCENCRALLEAWRDVDRELGAHFGGVTAPAGIMESVRRRAAGQQLIRRPSLLPEALDFIGWAAVLLLAALFLPHLLLRL